jgi:hypothetical protein
MRAGRASFSGLGANDEQERQQTQYGERGELYGAVHEINGVEPSPDFPRSGIL